MVEEVNKLKQLVSGDILINGSGQLVRELMEHDLIDEYRLMVFPIVLGSGKRLFTDAAKATTLRSTDTRWTGDAVFLTYEPARVLAETK
jgi:dihydrofolate reductase